MPSINGKKEPLSKWYGCSVHPAAGNVIMNVKYVAIWQLIVQIDEIIEEKSWKRVALNQHVQ